jgi:hypothetical protein
VTDVRKHIPSVSVPPEDDGLYHVMPCNVSIERRFGQCYSLHLKQNIFARGWKQYSSFSMQWEHEIINDLNQSLVSVHNSDPHAINYINLVH